MNVKPQPDHHQGIPMIPDVDNSSAPSDVLIIKCVADHFGVSFGAACDMILAAADRMKGAA